MNDKRQAIVVLTLNTFAFAVCFAAWMMNGVLVTFLVDNGVYHWDQAQIGWLIGIPVLTGALMRLPVGVLTDRFGGRLVYTLLILLSAVPMFLASYASTYGEFILAGLGFGLTGASFAVGVAYTSAWFPKERQGTALGIFGVGNIGSALTAMFAPGLLRGMTAGGANLDGWRSLPRMYAALLVVTGIVFWLSTKTRIVAGTGTTIARRLAPLARMRVWRFGLYYFVVFGGFVALSQWLIPYYLSAYGLSLGEAGMMAAMFSLPAGLARVLGGWLSDRYGGRAVMYRVFGLCLVGFALLCVPRMEIESPGAGLLAEQAGIVTDVAPERVAVGDRVYVVKTRPAESVTPHHRTQEGTLVLPTFEMWQEPVVHVGDHIAKKQLLALGTTHIFFQANTWIFSGIVFVIGILMGVGMAGVYKLIPDYFPTEVGVVGGLVGVLGGLGGFLYPTLFGFFLMKTGIWTSAWAIFFVLTFICLAWLHLVVRRMMRQSAPELDRRIEVRGIANGKDA
jgi:NNP family nitrate/nitrite transporter-like MFS transporter